MHAIQVFKSKTKFLIIEIMFGVAQAAYVENIEDLARHLKCNSLYNNPKALRLPFVHVNNAELKRLATTNQ
jgi:hypothetical protein